MPRFSQGIVKPKAKKKGGMPTGVYIFIGLILLAGAVLGILAAAGVKWWTSGDGSGGKSGGPMTTRGGGYSYGPGPHTTGPHTTGGYSHPAHTSGQPPNTTSRINRSTRPVPPPGTTVKVPSTTSGGGGCTTDKCLTTYNYCGSIDSDAQCANDGDCCNNGVCTELTIGDIIANTVGDPPQECLETLTAGKWCVPAGNPPCTPGIDLDGMRAAASAGVLQPEMVGPLAANLLCDQNSGACCSDGDCSGASTCSSRDSAQINSLCNYVFGSDGAAACLSSVKTNPSISLPARFCSQDG